MAVDRGGLRYRIGVEYDPNPARSFREDIQRSRRAFRQLRDEIARSGESARAFTQIAAAQDRLTRSEARRQRTAERTLETTRATTSAQQEALRRARAAARERDVLRAAEERGLNLTRRLNRELTLEEQAHRRVEQALRRRLVQERAAELAGRRAVELGIAKARAATVEEEAQRRIERAERRRAVTSRALELAGDRAVELGLARARALTAEEEGALRVTRALRRQAVAQAELNARRQAGLAVSSALRRQAAGGIFSPEQEANERIEASLRRQSIAQAEINARKARGLPISESLRRQAAGSAAEFQRGQTAASRLLFTFRRLIGVLALFQGARLVFRAFTDAIRGAVAFNATIETAELGISSLLVAVADVRDALAGSVEPAEQLALAQAEARRQTRLLRQDAINTQATFAELLRAFQEAVAPGLVAGLTVDQVREFSVRISQAAGALGLAQNQLAEEIRSILSGTIQRRTTRIATALGITNEDIRRAREAGVLFEFLQGEFEAFEAAGERALGTFTGLTARINDAFRAVTGQAAETFFDDLLLTLRELFDLLTSEDPVSGLLEPRPEVVAIFREVFDVLAEGLSTVREFARELSFEEARRNASALAGTIGTALQVIIGFVTGLVEGVAVLVGLFEAFAEGSGRSVRELAADLGRVSTFLLSIVLPLRVIFGLFGSIAGNVTRIRRGLSALQPVLVASVARARAIGGAILATLAPVLLRVRALLPIIGRRLLALLGPVALIAAEVAAILEILRNWIQQLSGADVTIGQTLTVTVLGLAQAFDDVRTAVQLLIVALQRLIQAPREGLRQAGEGISNTVDALLAGITDALGADAISEELQRSIEDRLRERDLRVEGISGTEGEILSQLRAQEEQILANARARERERSAQVSAILDPDAPDAPAATGGAATGEAVSLLDVFSELPAPLSTVSQRLAEIEKDLADIAEQARATFDEFSIAQATADLSGPAGQIANLFGEAEAQAREQSRQLSAGIAADAERLVGLRERELQIGERLSRLALQDRASIEQALALRRQIVETEREVSAVDQDIRRTSLEINALREQGRDSSALEVERELLRTERDKRQAIVDQGRERLAAVTLGEEAADVARDLAETEGQILSTERDLTEQRQVQVDLASQLLSLAATRAATAATRAIPQLARENELLAVQAENEQRLAAAQQQRFGGRSEAAVQAENAVRVARIELDLRLREIRANAEAVAAARAELEVLIEQLAVEIEMARLRGEDTSQAERALDARRQEAAALGELEGNLRRRLALENEAGAAGIEQLEIAQERLDAIDSGTFGEGIREGFARVVEELPTQFEAAATIIRDTVTSLASFISQSIVAAFDPSQDATFRERLGQFLQQLGQQILNQLIQTFLRSLILRIAGFLGESGLGGGAAPSAQEVRETQRLLQRQQIVLQELQAFGLFNAGATTLAPIVPTFSIGAGALASGATTLAEATPAFQRAASTLLTAALIQAAASGTGAVEGGIVPRAAAASAAHFSPIARGLATGGSVRAVGGRVTRPPGIDHRDTVPLWAQPGEVMIRKRVVDKPGMRRFLLGLNAGLISTHRAFNSMPAVAAAAFRRAPGYQEGGLIGDQLAQQTALAEQAALDSGSGEGRIVPLVIMDREQADRALAGGLGDAIFEMLEAEPQRLNSIATQGGGTR